MIESKEDLTKIKLVDFGGAQKYLPWKSMSAFFGSPYYIAPEVLSGKYNFKCDMWSVGILTYYLISGAHPFDSSIENKIIE